MKTEDKKNNQELEYLTQQLALHVAAMKPVYLNKKEVPQTLKDEAIAKGPGDKALWALYNREVLMEQELATSEDPLKVK